MPPASMLARARACLLASFILAIGACDGADPLTDPSDNAGDVAAAGPVMFDTDGGSSRGGTPIGIFALPTTEFGSRYTGGLRNIYSKYLLKELAGIKARGGRVVLMFAGNERHYKDADGHFDLGKWKARVDNFKSTNFTSYVSDGTVLAHFLMDEPNDPANWNGKQVTAAQLEEMAEYSKRLWPSMPTVVRTEPAYLGAKPRYIDAAWAQYVQRKGTPTEYLRRHVADAEQRGLALIVGMNILKGTLGKTSFSAGQLREWGSAMLNSSYPCAFISWTYDANYLGRSDVKEAMDVLANKARTHQAKSCRGGNGQTSGSVPQPVEPPAPPVLPDPSEAPAPAAEIRLTITQWTASGRNYMRLTWAGATGSLVDIYRNGEMRGSTANDGRHTNSPWSRAGSTYAFKVCETGTSKCSKTVTATFGSQSR
ncbi:MAG: hypothetical protein H0T58_06630 [Gemmatimonadales bacterium]|nr:hypothetical protein [Gemmatimonadales bacterium]